MLFIFASKDKCLFLHYSKRMSLENILYVIHMYFIKKNTKNLQMYVVNDISTNISMCALFWDSVSGLSCGRGGPGHGIGT